jgi:hypothetical protein
LQYALQQPQPTSSNPLGRPALRISPPKVSRELLPELEGRHVHRFRLLLERQFLEGLGIALVPSWIHAAALLSSCEYEVP